jgi:hypothetical protein
MSTMWGILGQYRRNYAPTRRIQQVRGEVHTSGISKIQHLQLGRTTDQVAWSHGAQSVELDTLPAVLLRYGETIARTTKK